MAAAGPRWFSGRSVSGAALRSTGLDHTAIIAVFFVAGLMLLLAETVIPSSGMLTVGALVCLAIAVVNTYMRSTTAGLIATVVCVVTIPTLFILGIKYVRYLPFGKHLAPPNPVLTDKDRAYDRSGAQACLGQDGRAVTPLRPVGLCEFSGRRIQCVAESGMIETGAEVTGVDLRLNQLVVRPVHRQSTDRQATSPNTTK